MDDLEDDVYLVGALGPPQVIDGADPDRRYCVVQQGSTVRGHSEEKYEILDRLRHGILVRELLPLLGPDGQRQLAELVRERLVVVDPLRRPELLDELLLVSVLEDLGPYEGSELIHTVRFGDGTEARISVHTLAMIEECDAGRTLGQAVALAEEHGTDRDLLIAMLDSDLGHLFAQRVAMFDWLEEQG
ncbi:hypothetical protein [Kineococcus xinjiangensis]|uniref:hypothetical protein n=1 Tax=Kineococcus xinjiangensis TaxID=512762 RepID=UPI000CEC8970|nr:hypothetical protein [Kineococcus xinjiangensis]